MYGYSCGVQLPFKLCNNALVDCLLAQRWVAQYVEKLSCNSAVWVTNEKEQTPYHTRTAAAFASALTLKLQQQDCLWSLCAVAAIALH